MATSNVTHAGEGGLIFTVTVAQFSFVVFQPPSPAPPSLPSPPITPNPVEYCWRESVEFKVTVGGSGKGDGGLWPARLLGTHPLPIILLYCTPHGPLPACRPEEAFLRASSSRKSDNLSALLKTQPQTKTGGDRERPQSYQPCRDEGGWGCPARCRLKFEEAAEEKPEENVGSTRQGKQGRSRFVTGTNAGIISQWNRNRNDTPTTLTHVCSTAC